MLRYAFRFKKDLFLASWYDFLWAMQFISIPVLTGITFDIFAEVLGSNTNSFDQLFWNLVTIFSLILLEYVSMGLVIYHSGLLSTKVSEAIRNDVFYSLQEQSHKFFDEENTGDLVSKATTDITNVIDFFANATVLGPLLIGEFIFIFFYLFNIDLQIGIICLLAIPIMYILSRRFEKRYTPVMLESQNKFGELSSVLTENVDAARVVRTFPSQHKEINRFDDKNSKFRDLKIRAHKMRAMLNTQGPLSVGLVTISILFVGGMRTIQGEMSIGTLIVVVFLTSYLEPPVRHIGTVAIHFSNLKASGERIVKILESVPDIQEKENSIRLDNSLGQISIKNVSFGFQDEAVLEDINLEFDAHAKIAILGGTGSGKSSLINLIPRYYDVKSGKVLIDGHDVRDLHLETLRKSIGYVDQETFLFSKMIKENIAFGKPDATDGEIIKVAKIAQIHDFIESLPEGYETVIGERGVTLSGGQKQRLSIARALLADPAIVVFDDSLSAVDIRTEREIQDALDALLIDRTVIFVTQRLSTTSSADQIVILDKGRVVEIGTHPELLSKDGIYARLYRTQEDDIMDLSVISDSNVIEVINK